MNDNNKEPAPPAPGKPGPLPPKFTRIELMDFVQWFTEIKPEKGLVADYDGMIEGKSLAISHRRMKQLLAILEEWSDQNSKEIK